MSVWNIFKIYRPTRFLYNIVVKVFIRVKCNYILRFLGKCHYISDKIIAEFRSSCKWLERTAGLQPSLSYGSCVCVYVCVFGGGHALSASRQQQQLFGYRMRQANWELQNYYFFAQILLRTSWLQQDWPVT